MSSPSRLVQSWVLGIVIGTTIIASTSPLFVRTYLPLQADATRGVWTLPANHVYRWRSEGYANTRIGPLGMPGKLRIPEPPSSTSRTSGVWHVALWGDSQAEGVCVADRDKLFAQIEWASRGQLEVFPLARSGEDAADWLTQMPAVEQALDLDFHVILAVDLLDLVTATQAPLPPPSPWDVAAAHASIATWAPALVIQAARHLLTGADESTRRKLRFAIGPAVERSQGASPPHSRSTELHSATPHSASPLSAEPRGLPWDESLSAAAMWRREMQAIRNASRLPILILYAPVTPQIIAGHVVTEDAMQEALESMKRAAVEVGLLVATSDEELRQSAARGNWPHGFHNGYIGSGHLNRHGNAVLAAIVSERILSQREVNQEATMGEGSKD